MLEEGFYTKTCLLIFFLCNFGILRGYAQEINSGYNKEIVIPSNSFEESEFKKYWDYGYPWGNDHNGTAKMNKKQVRIQNGELILTADRLTEVKEKSSKNPHLPITYHSGAIFYKDSICVDEQYPFWKIEGEFVAPISVGTWPAFWITGISMWPPESDVLEFKGSNVNWQNTVNGTDWKHTEWQTEKSSVLTASSKWHTYGLTLQKLNDNSVILKYYIDGSLKASHIADFYKKPFHLIINLQTEGASGKTGSGPQQAVFKARNVQVVKFRNY